MDIINDEIRESLETNFASHLPSMNRYDIHLSYNSLSFWNSFGKEGSIIVAILHYLAFKYNEGPESYYAPLNLDLFKEEVKDFSKVNFDPHDFALFMCNGDEKSSRIWLSNLQRAHEDPEYLRAEFGVNYKSLMDEIINLEIEALKQKAIRKWNIPDCVYKENGEEESSFNIRKNIRKYFVDNWKAKYPGPHFDSVLDNALFKAANQKLYWRFNGSNVENSYSAVGGIEFFHSVIKIQKNENKRKISYLIYVNKTFEKNLCKAFLVTNNSHMKNLLGNNLIYAAGYLDYLRHVNILNKKAFVETNFKLLKEMFLIEASTPAKIKQEIGRKIKMLNKFGYGVRLNWVKDENQNYKYVPELSFTDKEIYVNKMNTKEGFEDFVVHRLWDFFENKYKNRYPKRINKEGFNNWRTMENLDLNDKIKIFQTSYHEIFNSTIPDNDKRILNFFNTNKLEN